MRATRAFVGLATSLLLCIGGAATVQADDFTPDSYQQIASGDLAQIAPQVPADGTPYDFYYGRAYMGPNGLEIRLNNRGTLIVAHELEGGAILATGEVAGPLLDGIILAAGSNLVVDGTLGAIDLFGSDYFDNVLMANKCLGITVSQPVTVADQMILGQPAVVALAGHSTAWLEECSS